MAHVIVDRVRETSTTTGTGTLALAGAATNFRAFSSVMANGDTTLYSIVDHGNNAWEIGVGTWATGNNLARTTVISSSNAGALVSFAAGVKDVFMTFTPAGPVGAMSAGVTPTIFSVGAEFTNTAAPTATLPGGTLQTNDILVVVLQSSNQDLATPTDYARIGPQNGIGAAATAASTRMGIFWKRHDGSEAAPSIADSGDHTYGFMFAVRGCRTTGDPFQFMGNGWKFTNSTTGTAPGGNTGIDNCLITAIFANNTDNATGQASSPVNASLTGVNLDFNNGTTDGTGGGLALVSGTLSEGGAFSATTLTWGTTAMDLSTTVAWIPAEAIERVRRPPEQQIFIGSLANVNDTWVKPYGAERILVQLMDGGGSGSGGNTTTTAAGGGGGGGGGYDEALYLASDLAATITLRAGAGGAAGTALNQAGNAGTVSFFESATIGPLGPRITGTAATAAASADGGNGGCGGGTGFVSPAVTTARLSQETTTDGVAYGTVGGRGGSGTTAPTGGSPAMWGGGGGESGGDTDAALTAATNGWSVRGGGGGGGGRTNANASIGGHGGGGQAGGGVGGAGAASTRLPFGGAGGNGGGTGGVVGGAGGFPGGGGGGGAGIAGGFGGAGGHGCIVVTTMF